MTQVLLMGFLFSFQCGPGASEWALWPSQRDVLWLTTCYASPGGPLCPEADAGGDDLVLTGSPVMLDGTASSGPDANLRWLWSQVPNGAPMVTLTGADTSTPSFSPPQAGIYEFELEVGWRCLADTDAVSVEARDVILPPQTLDAGLIADLSMLPAGFTSFSPVKVVSTPGEMPRLYIVDFLGFVWIWENNAIDPTPLLDVSGLLGNCFECGLSNLVFHPDFDQNGYFYIQYVGTLLDGTGNAITTRIAGFQAGAERRQIEAGSGVDLLSINQPTDIHNGGDSAFGPDGFFYLAMGDGGPQNDPNGNAQNPLLPNGKLLRYQINGLNPPTIPGDNPFVGDPGVLDEIYAIGFRNPWRFSFDRLTGDLYLGDNGQNAVEEVSFQAAGAPGGANFGWNIMEGDQCFNPPMGCDMTGLTLPAYAYSHTGGGCSVIGGYVYRGGALPELRGYYVYGDWCLGEIFLLRFENGSWVNRPVTVTNAPGLTGVSLIGFGEDADGELYFCSGSNVYKIVDTMRR